MCIGLSGSGKTSLLSKLCSESPEHVVSTTGGYPGLCPRPRAASCPVCL